MRSFKIPCIPSTTQKTIRFPNDVIKRVEKTIIGKDCSFSAFIVAATTNALDELEKEKNIRWSQKEIEVHAENSNSINQTVE